MKSTQDENAATATGPAAPAAGAGPRPADGVPPAAPGALPREIGGRDGPEPTRYGDWEKAGRCIDF